MEERRAGNRGYAQAGLGNWAVAAVSGDGVVQRTSGTSSALQTTLACKNEGENLLKRDAPFCPVKRDCCAVLSQSGT